MIKLFLLLWALKYSVGLKEKIVGGKPAKLGEVPYIVSIRLLGKHRCGGSILNEKFILTAAHCIDGFENSSSNLTILYGTVDLKQYGTVASIANITKHRNYVPYGGYLNDIAIIEVNATIMYGTNVQPVELPYRQIKYEESAVLSGWGYEKNNGSAARYLQVANVTILKDYICRAYIYTYNNNYHICAGDMSGGHSQCNGDSGGPLINDGVQHGIVSWSYKPCASPNNPGVFTKVLNYLEFIESVLGH